MCSLWLFWSFRHAVYAFDEELHFCDWKVLWFVYRKKIWVKMSKLAWNIVIRPDTDTSKMLLNLKLLLHLPWKWKWNYCSFNNKNRPKIQNCRHLIWKSWNRKYSSFLKISRFHCALHRETEKSWWNNFHDISL